MMSILKCGHRYDIKKDETQEESWSAKKRLLLTGATVPTSPVPGKEYAVNVSPTTGR